MAAWGDVCRKFSSSGLPVEAGTARVKPSSPKSRLVTSAPMKRTEFSSEMYSAGASGKSKNAARLVLFAVVLQKLC